MNGQHTAYIALGSNQADREANLRRAIEALGRLDGCTVTACSEFRPYPAEGTRPGAPEYLNGVASIQTSLSPFALWRGLVAIETEMGRPEAKDRPVNADRVIDLDLLLYDQAVIATQDLVIPHPRMHRRRFVLEPLAAIGPEAFHPVLGRPARQLLERLDRSAKSDT